MYKEVARPSNLAKTLMVFDYVFVDTCSLMNDSFPLFMDDLSKSKEYWTKKDFHFIIPGECINELNKHLNRTDGKHDTIIEAKRALKILKHEKRLFKKKRCLEFSKPISNDNFADNAILTRVSALRIQYKILVITQDKTLATDLKRFNTLDSARGRYVIVYRLNEKGDLEDNPGLSAEEAARKHADIVKKYEQKNPKVALLNQDKTKQDKQSEQPSAISTKFDDIKAFDRALKANVSNPNYPVERKLKDIDDQLERLSSIADNALASLNLGLSKEALKEAKLKFGGEAKEAETPKAAKPKAKKASPEAKPDIIEALKEAFAEVGAIVRDSDVEYVKEVHGPIDVTIEDINALNEAYMKSKTGSANKTLRGWKVEMSASGVVVKPKETAKKKEEKTEKTLDIEEKPAPKPKKKAVKNEEVVDSEEETPSGKEERLPTEEIIKEDFRLNSKINNPTYPIESKIKDLEAQKKALHGIKAANQEGLMWPTKKINATLKSLREETPREE